MYKVTNNSQGGIQWHATNSTTQVIEPYYVPGGATVMVQDYVVTGATDLQPRIDAAEVTATAE